ncbi:MAG: PAS domain-containing sensor histidine kinase [Thermoanaerobaculales bacterium]
MTRIGRFFGTRGSLQRQFAAATAVLLILMLGIIFLYGHLIAGSLSRRYLEDTLAGGRAEALRIADELGGAEVKDFDVLERRREVLERTLEGDPRRRIWESIEVTDSEGKVVFSTVRQSTEKLPEAMAEDLQLRGALSDQAVTETDKPYTISVPLGEIGNVVLNVNRAQVAERVARLRGELLAQTVTLASLTVITLVAAFILVWFLVQRAHRLEAARHEAEEMADLGALAANLAHEIRNPLNSINLNLELLNEDLLEDTAGARASLATTRREVGRLARLVSDFLSYARPTRPDLEPVRMDAMLTEVRDFLCAEAKNEGVHLRVSPGLPVVEVRCDEAQLRQVLFNLVLNAVQAVSSLAADRRVVELAAEQRPESLALIVRDRGDGIPERELGQVCRAFYTRRRGGTGLGLAIAERFVESQGGQIELENLEPNGFEARVVLPIDKDNVKMSG